MNGATPSEGDGPRLISRHVLEGFRRERIFLAVAELAQDEGPGALTTTQIVKRGRMSRNTFYGLFANKAECLDLACEFATDRLAASIGGALPEGGGWRCRLGRVVSTFLEAVAAEPEIAALCLIHTATISTRGETLGVGSVIETLSEAIENAAAEPGEIERGSVQGLSEFVAATLVSIVVRRLMRGEGGELPRLGGQLTELAVRLWSEPAERVETP